MYLKTVEKNNITYSVDMIRFRTNITYEKYSEIEFRFKVAYKEYVSKYYISSQISQFKYNYSIEVGEGQSFWFGFLHNSESYASSDKAEYNFTLEFNPNKLKDCHLIMYLLNVSREWFIRSVDIAMDLPLNILDISWDKLRKREIDIFSKGFDNKTVYIGKSDGRTKIYNKKRESNLDITTELTRVEVSYNLDNYPIKKISSYHFKGILPELYTNNYLYTFETYKDKTLFAILYAVQCGFDVSYLSRAYKEKLKNMLKGNHILKFDRFSIEQVIRQVVIYYGVNSKIMI